MYHVVYSAYNASSSDVVADVIMSTKVRDQARNTVRHSYVIVSRNVIVVVTVLLAMTSRRTVAGHGNNTDRITGKKRVNIT